MNLMNSSIYLCMILVTAYMHAGMLMTHKLAESIMQDRAHARFM